jgi:hypothetical protein
VTHDDRRAPGDDDLDALVADAFALRGEIVPTTAAEVRAAEEGGVEFEGELPPALAALGEASHASPLPPPSRAIASMDDRRRARERRLAPFWTHAGSFALGVAAAACALLFLRAPGREAAHREPDAGPAGTAAASSAATPARVVIPAVSSCREACCAGSSCAAAQGELKACASGRTCVGCGEVAEAGAVYRVRIGSVSPTRALEGKELSALDLCVRVGGSPWSCEPAHADPATRPQGRTLPTLASAPDIAAGIEIELRPRGEKLALGRWRDSVRLGRAALCRGVGALIANEKQEHLGSLSLFLDDAHYVELGRAADVEALRERRASIEFGDVIPEIVETTRAAGERYALTIGPLDKATAERLRWELLERSRAARVVLGEDYAGAGKPLR